MFSRIVLLSFLARFVLCVSVQNTTITHNPTSLPDYAFTFAPLSYLYSSEMYFPSDIVEHLQNTIPEINFTAIGPMQNLSTLDSLPDTAFLTSIDDPLTNPAWLTSIANKPNSAGLSRAPATIIAVEKGNGIVDVFYFYFYSFNQGNFLLGILLDDHVGDWEHTMIRFINGEPIAIFLSEHDFSSAYTWDAITKLNGRPQVYVGNGTHANWPLPGGHSYTVPFGLLTDQSDIGLLWDVTLNFRGYWFDNSTSTFTSAGGVGIGGSEQESETPSWLSWLGAWGDEQYLSTDPRQYDFDGEAKFTSGPTGPFDKNLGRTTVCQDDATCVVLDSPDAPIPGAAVSPMFTGDNAVVDGLLSALVSFRAAIVAANFTVLTS